MLLHKTKIIATVGPACNTYDKLCGLVKEGVNVFRLNFSHGTHDAHLEVINHIRRINTALPFNIAILADLQGPKLRVGEIEGGVIELAAGDEFYFTNEPCVGTRDCVYISYPDLYKDVQTGEKIYIDDGKVQVVVREITTDRRVRVEVTVGGPLSSR